MKKIYLTITTALLGATTAFGQGIEYDIATVLQSPVSKSTIEKQDSIPLQFQLQNIGTTTIPAGDTIWLTYGVKDAPTYYAITGQPGVFSIFLVPDGGWAPNTALGSPANLKVSLQQFAVGDTIEVYFWDITAKENEDGTQDPRTEAVANQANNQDWFVLNADTTPLPECSIKGDDKVCKDSTLQLEGIPTGGEWKVNPANDAVTLTQTGQVKGVKAGETVTIEYSGAVCTGTATHKVTVNDCPTSGINDLDINSISAYPNPATDVLNIQSYETVESVSILSLDGKVLSTTYGQKVDISNLNSGVYLYRVTSTKGESAVSKFVKQ